MKGFEFDTPDLEPFIENRLLPLKTLSNDVHPVGTGEVLRRIIGKCVMDIVKDVQKAVGNLRVYVGQCAGAEAAMHGMRELYNDKDYEAVLLVDASNTYNTLNREAMMHNTGILCPTLTTFVQNTYRQPAHLILSERSTITSEEGTTQGDPIAKAVYSRPCSPIQEKKNKSTEHWG